MNRNRLTVLLVAAAGLALSACTGALGGFTPLYATTAGAGLSRIEVRAPEGRTGYLLRQQLDDAMGRSRGEPPLYRLTMTAEETRIPRGLRIDNVANRYELTLKITYALQDAQTRKVLTRGIVVSDVTFDSADQAYAGIAANEDGQLRAATEGALRVRERLAAYFANPEAVEADETGPATAPADIITLTDRLAPQTIEPPAAKADVAPEAGAPREPGGN